MKKFLKIIVFLILLIALGAIYQFRDPILTQLPPFFDIVLTKLNIFSTPCEKPIPYTLGTFDTEFGISQKYFLSALAEAEAVWEKPFGKQLFTYKEGAKENMLKINLVYDYRQQATSKLASLGITVKDNRASYDELKARLTKMKADFSAAKSNYEARLESYNTRQKAYEKDVTYWNGEGGAPKKEYERLQAEKDALDAEASQLHSLQKNINEMVDEINSLVVVLNRLAETLNISVEKYNTIGASRGESFEEGVYQSNGITQEIDIYEFSSRAKLVRVLAHELGHALGLAHVDDPKAIMYRLNQGNSEILTSADLAALEARCGK